MAFDESDLDAIEQPPLPAEPARLKPWQLLWDCIARPAAAMARLAEHPGWRRWIWPLGLLTLLDLGIFALQTPMRNRLAGALIQAQMAKMQAQAGNAVPQAGGVTAAGLSGGLNLVQTVMGAVSIPVGLLLGTLLTAAVLHFVGTVLGGQQAFGQVFTTAAWARTPLILGAVVKLAGAAVGNFDVSPAGLSGLVAADPFGDSPAAGSYLGPLLGQVELWNLWYLALLAVAVLAVSRVSRGKAAGAVALLLVLRLLTGVAGVAMGNVFRNFGR